MWEVPEGVQRYPQFFIINKNAIIITTCHIGKFRVVGVEVLLFVQNFYFFPLKIPSGVGQYTLSSNIASDRRKY